MIQSKGDVSLVGERDAIEAYFECITSCSLEGEGIECTTRCIEVHFKSEIEL